VIQSQWKALDPDVRAFINEFERRGDDPESDTGDQFADMFVVADPTQAVVIGRDILLASLPSRREMFSNAGVGSARLVEASQLELDDRHVLVTSDWDADRSGLEPVRLESTFLLRREPGGLRILVYLNHRDISTVLKSL
jgi:hypothetical protein